MYRIMVSQDGKHATVHYNNGKTINLYESGGQVLDLVVFILTPSCGTEVTLSKLVNSLDDTSSVAA